MLYILDTDHVSLLQRQHPVVLRNLQNISSVNRAVTVITLAEQVQGRLATFRRARNEAESSRMLQFLIQTMEFYQTIQVLPYDDKSVMEFERFRQLKIRIGTQDLRIAAIALSNQATVVTRNYRDFRRVPELNITDWTVS